MSLNHVSLPTYTVPTCQTASYDSAFAAWRRKLDQVLLSRAVTSASSTVHPGNMVSRSRLMTSFHVVRGLPCFLWPWSGVHLYSLSGSCVLFILCTARDQTTAGGAFERKMGQLSRLSSWSSSWDPVCLPTSVWPPLYLTCFSHLFQRGLYRLRSPDLVALLPGT